MSRVFGMDIFVYVAPEHCQWYVPYIHVLINLSNLGALLEPLVYCSI